MDYRRSRKTEHAPLCIHGEAVERVDSIKFLGIHISSDLSWSVNTSHLVRKAQQRLFFLRRLRSFEVCSEMLHMFYQSVVASVLFYAAVCWGGSMTDRNSRRLDRLVKKASSVLGRSLDPLGAVVERRTRSIVQSILENDRHPLHSILEGQRSSNSWRLISLRCRTERFRRSFVPSAIRLHNTLIKGSGS